MSQGHARKYFIIGCVSSLITVLGFIIGIHWGVIGTVIAFTVTAYLILVPTLISSFAGTPIKISMFFSEISAPMIHAIIMSIFLLLLKGLLIERVSQIIIFLIAAPLGAIFYYFSWEIYALGRKRIAMVKDLISSIASKLSRGKQLRLLTIFNKKTISKNSDSSHF
jgi:PST family polysaccharide transporter